MTVAYLTQEEFKTFERKAVACAKAGIELDYSVAQRNKRKVKVTLNKKYDFEELDRVSEGVN